MACSREKLFSELADRSIPAQCRPNFLRQHATAAVAVAVLCVSVRPSVMCETVRDSALVSGVSL